MSKLKNHTIIGQFGKTQGLHGAIRINSYTQPKENIFTYQPWILSDESSLRVASWKQHGQNIIAELADYDTIEKAKTLTDQLIHIPRSDLPELEEGTYYWEDLEGLQVINQENTLLGEVDYVFEGMQFAIIVVKRAKRQPLLVPYQKTVVLNVSLEKRIIEVDWDDID